MQYRLVLYAFLRFAFVLVFLDGLYQVSVFVQHFLYLSWIRRRPVSALGERQRHFKTLLSTNSLTIRLFINRNQRRINDLAASLMKRPKKKRSAMETRYASSFSYYCCGKIDLSLLQPVLFNNVCIRNKNNGSWILLLI